MIDADFVKKEVGKYNLRYWDFRYESSQAESILLWNKEVRQLGSGCVEGFGIRAIAGNGIGFAASNNTDKESIKKKIKEAVRIAELLNSKKQKIFLPEIKAYKDKKEIGKNFKKMDLADKKDFLLQQNYKIDDEIKSVYLRYQDASEKKLFLSNESEINEKKSYTYLIGGVSASSLGKNEEQIFRIAKTEGFHIIKNVQEEIDKCIKNVKTFINADKVKPGKSDVVLSGSISGLFAHEALGHASEADAISQSSSCLRGLIGKKLAPDYISILDDPTQEDYSGWGSYYYDDEGTKSNKNYIIRQGKLNSYLTSVETAGRLKANLTGNGRAESVLNKPIPRMSNTYFEKGDFSFEEMIGEIKQGYFLDGFKGGETDPAKGEFQFGVERAYYVQNGEIIKPLRGAGFGGKTLELLKKIKFIEKEYSEDSPGFCGKAGQSVPAGGRNPAIFVEGAVLI